jgi:hypothetical protein
MKDIGFGLLGGVLGAALWAGVTFVTEYEIGWIAWAVGGIVGYAVALGNAERLRAPTAAGALAVIITVVSIVAGKAMAVQMMIPSDAEIMEMFAIDFEDEEYVISYLADEVASEFVSEGRAVEWPEDVDPGSAAEASDYPADVWAEAVRRWDELGEEGQAEFRLAQEVQARANVEANLPAIREAMASGGFFGSFAPMDLIFFGLAMVTAFGLASGGKSGASDDDDEEVVDAA